MKRLDTLLLEIDDILLLERLSIPSLFIGDLGRVLYYAYRFLQTEDEKFSFACKKLLETIIDQSSDYALDSTLGNGITGICWIVKHLVDIGILEKTDIATVEDVLPYVETSISQDFENGNYDYIYGCMGKISCLSDYDFVGENVNDNKILSFFNNLKCEDDKGVFWMDTDKADHVNLGNAHGMPSIVLFLLNSVDTTAAKYSELIPKSIDWILSQRKKKGVSTFPYDSDASDCDSRLAWCFGDLGIAYMLFVAAEQYKNDEWYKAALEISEKASQRKLKNSGIVYIEDGDFYDTGFCHGTSGVAYLFSKLAAKTQDYRINEATSYWLNQNLNNIERHIHHFKNLPKQDYTSEQNIDSLYCQNIGLLEGIIGPALVAIASTHDNLDGWSDLFLLNK